MPGRDPLTAASPLWRRLAGYVAERFPPLTTAVVVLAFFCAALFSMQALWRAGQPLRVDGRMAAGAVALVLVFFHLRLFDEFKDGARDARAHPQRLLSRGVVTLPLLGRVLGVVLAIEALLAIAIGPPAALWLSGVVLYSVAMRYEFGVGHWLQQHPLLYAISHMAITPLMALYVASFAAASAPLSARVWPVIALATCATVAYELGRKTWAPEQEHADADSYSKLWGTTGAGLAVLVAIAAATVASVYLCRALQLAWAADAVIAAVALAAAAVAIGFMRQPTIKTAKLLGLLTSLLLLVDLSAVAIAVAVARGIALDATGPA